MNEPQILKVDQNSKKTQITNEPQVKEPKISKETKIMNGPQILKEH
jgi:hypothetical protein